MADSAIGEEFRHDIEKVNALALPRFKSGNFALELTNKESCEVHWVRDSNADDKLGPSVTIQCRDAFAIEAISRMSTVCPSELKILEVSVRWDVATSSCLLKRIKDQTAIQPWEISQQALHHLFFDAFLE